MNVLIAGCGYLGCALGQKLLARGSRVWGLCRSEASLAAVRAAGLEPVRADLNDRKSLVALPDYNAVVTCQAPAKGETYERSYLDATVNLLRTVEAASRPVRWVMISSTSVYGSRDDGWVDADTPIDPKQTGENARALLEAERLVTTAAAPVQGMVLRLSGLYGPGRSRIDSLRSGRMQALPGSAYTNRIHRDDAASAAGLILERGKSGQIYLATDDAPVTQTEFYEWLCSRMGLAFPPAGNPHGQTSAESKRCSNAKLKQLGWKPEYPSYREGYGALLV